MPEKNESASLPGKLRMLWRDLLLSATDLGEYVNRLVALNVFWDTGYQYKWTKLDVHRTMLADQVRVKAFEKAINEVVADGDLVVDVGTGTGVLAFMAAKAGAKKVYAVDSAGVIELAREVGEHNKLDNIEFLRTDVRDLSIPKVDVIICELLGPHVIEEGFTEKIRMAKHSLKAGGKIIPSKIDAFIAPVECKDGGVGFWDNLYGVDYTPIARDVGELRFFDMSKKTRRLSKDVLAFSIDSYNPPEKNIEFENEYTVESDGEFHGMMMHFNARLSPETILSTSPESPVTHWRQTFIPEGGRTKVEKGDKIRFRLWATNKNKNWKWKFNI